MRPFRVHWPAVFVAMIVTFLFEAAWYSYFMTPWLVGINRTMESLRASGMNSAVQYATAMLCALIVAAVLSMVVQATGSQTITRGVVCGAMLWIGFIATTWATEYVFEARSLQIYAITAGFWLIDLMVVGAIVGGWRGKARPE